MYEYIFRFRVTIHVFLPAFRAIEIQVFQISMIRSQPLRALQLCLPMLLNHHVLQSFLLVQVLIFRKFIILLKTFDKEIRLPHPFSPFRLGGDGRQEFNLQIFRSLHYNPRELFRIPLFIITSLVFQEF